MRAIEKILISIFLISIFLKMIPLPGASPLITLASLALFLLYFLGGFILLLKIKISKLFSSTSYSGYKAIDILLAVFGGISIALLLLGILFKLNYWPGAAIMTLQGCMVAIPIVVLSVSRLAKTNAFLYKSILFRLVPLLLFSIVLVILPVSTRLQIFKVHDKNIEEQILEHSKQQNQ